MPELVPTTTSRTSTASMTCPCLRTFFIKVSDNHTGAISIPWATGWVSVIG